MVARPHLNAMETLIAARGGDDAIFDRIASGEGIGKIADSLGYSRTMLYRWRDHGPLREERKARWTEALKLSAEAHIENAMSDLEGLDDLVGNELTPARVQVATSKANFKKWLGGVLDRERFGEAQQAPITVNIGTLHLDALRQANRPALPFPTSQVLEAEVVSEDEQAERLKVQDYDDEPDEAA